MLSSPSTRQGQRGCCPFPLHPQSPPNLPPLRSGRYDLADVTILLDDSEHLFHNHQASVASLRLLFTFAPERRSASLRNQRSASPEYPPTRGTCPVATVAISGDGKGDQFIGSPEVKVPVGRAQMLGQIRQGGK